MEHHLRERLRLAARARLTLLHLLLLLLAGWRPPACAASLISPCMFAQQAGGRLFHTFWVGDLSNHHLLSISSLLNTQQGQGCVILWTDLTHVQTSHDWLRRHALADAVTVRVYDEAELTHGTILEGKADVMAAAAADDFTCHGADLARLLVLHRQAHVCVRVCMSGCLL